VIASTAFQAEVAELRRRAAALGAELGRVQDELRRMRAAVIEAPGTDLALLARIDSASAAIASFSVRLNGDPARGSLNESEVPSISGRVFAAMSSWETRLPPTTMARRAAESAAAELAVLSTEVARFTDATIAPLRGALDAARAPYTPGRRLPEE
jgi:hypothetical protein